MKVLLFSGALLGIVVIQSDPGATGTATAPESFAVEQAAQTKPVHEDRRRAAGALLLAPELAPKPLTEEPKRVK